MRHSDNSQKAQVAFEIQMLSKSKSGKSEVMVSPIKNDKAKVKEEEPDYKCSNCEYTSPSAYNMKRHLLVHSGLKPYKCHYCGYSCTAARDLIRHIFTHTGRKPYMCDQCEYSGTQACSLKRHLLRHNNEKPHSCEECGQ